MESSFRGRSIFVTGGTGAFGQKLVRYLQSQSPASITLFSRDEMKHAAAKRALASSGLTLKFRIGDICRAEDLELAIGDSDIIIHAAAMKHLPECEANPLASNLVNVTGTQNVVRAFQKSKAESLIFLSTDKSPYASSIYGAQKYIGEKLIIESSIISGPNKRAFNLRYSNVVDSTGAAFHIFGEQLRAGKKVTVNGSQTVRGFVTQAEVISCIEAGLRFAKGGETIVIKPRVIRISELAGMMQKIMGKGEVEIKETTSFLGEKDSATLIMAEERGIAKEFPEAELEAYLLDACSKHEGRKIAALPGSDALTLEHCELISGAKLEQFLKPVMKNNELI